MSRRVQYSPEALAQLDDLAEYLVERAGAAVADGYLDRLLDFCDRLAVEPIAAHHRDDLLPGLRTRTLEKSRIICFLTIGNTDVHILAIYGTGESWEGRLEST